jgi:cytochrome oxidase Cu insertion factor (SCO1/SenC/PrrC family)
MSKRAFWATVNIALVIIVGTLFVARSTAEEQIVVDRTASGPFLLIDHKGRPVTDRDFRGKFMLVFFGYTFCPDVCPIDLQIISKAVDALGEAGNRVQPIFITVDPKRDTVEVLARYVSHFHPRLLGLTGTPEQVAMAAQTYGVLYMTALDTMSDSDGAHAQYLVDHSALTYLLGPDGRFRAAFPHNTEPKKLAAGILKHLNDHSS